MLDVNPDTVIDPDPEVDVVPVMPPGVLTAVNLVADVPVAGAVYETDAVVLPVAVAVPMVGALGAVTPGAALIP